MHEFQLGPVELPSESEALRAEVRAFLDEEMASVSRVARAKSWFGCDPEFSRKLGERGWIGMSWPSRYGGHERPASDRYVVTEEMLAAGAPVGAHWIADRQSGPLILRFGTDEAKDKLLPGIVRGETYFCIGMSEPDAGSDLAAIKTSATRKEGGWVVNGSKLWTTNIAEAHYMIALVRTEKAGEARHAGMSQLIIDLETPGVTRSPIVDHQSEPHFGEAHFDDVFVPDAMVVGTPGNGWDQVNAELSLERSGPERYLSSYRLFEELVLAHRPDGGAGGDPVVERLIGDLTARFWTLRQMSLSVSDSIGRGLNPVAEAAIVKDLGATLEQDLPMQVQASLAGDFDDPSLETVREVMQFLLLFSPIFSLRGGTREILRGIIAREIGLR
jgi:alkylation response protein AidB-like acyl-CoA dehydrogenase